MKSWIKCFCSVLLIVIGISLTGCEPVGISGTIMNKDGELIKDVVTINLLSLSNSEVQVQAITKTSDGYFEFQEVPDGQYVILPICERQRFVPRLIAIETNGYQTEGILESQAVDKTQIASVGLQGIEFIGYDDSNTNSGFIQTSDYLKMAASDILASEKESEAEKLRLDAEYEAEKAELQKLLNEFNKTAKQNWRILESMLDTIR